jgi:hypothetical protein
MHDHSTQSQSDGLRGWLDDASLTPGQRKRIAIFQSVESEVCARIEEGCGGGELDVTDVAVLVIAPEAHGLFFDGRVGEGVSVIIGHRGRLHAFLEATLPPAPDVEVNPYADLLEPAPSCCVRVMVIDDESLTVMSYGTFVTVRMSPGEQSVA